METVTLTVFPTATELELTLNPSPCAYTCSAGVDVYKRQVAHCELYIKLFFTAFLKLLYKKCHYMLHVIPVSYTHLDVYKRQVLNPARVPL